MATDEDRQHAAHLLREYRSQLRLLELRKAKQGDRSHPSLDTEMEELRINIAALEPLTEREPAPEVKEAIRRYIVDDYMFMFTQFANFRTRLTNVEQQTGAIAKQHASAQEWRLTISEDVKALKGEQTEEKQARRRGQRFNRYLLVAVVIIIMLSVLFGRVYFL